MALTTIPFSGENMMVTSSHSYEREMYEREMHHRRQEEEYRRMQAWAVASFGQPMNAVPKADPNDPLAFLKNADNKLLLIGEPS